MIDHRRALTLAATAIDFPLDASDSGILESHIRDCAACRAELAAFHHDAARLAALPAIAPPAWVGGVIGKAHPPNRVLLLAAAALLLAASAGIAILIGGARQDARIPDVSPSVPALPSPVASPLPSASPEPARSPASTLAAVTAGTIPASLGGAQMAPGPDGGLYVLIDAPRELLAGPPSQTVLALLDGAGRPRPGWPVRLTGWSCGVPNTAYRAWTTATDGSTRLVCTEDVVGDAAPRHLAFAFDPTGRTMPGWPVEIPAGEVWEPPQVVGDELRFVAHEFSPSNGDGAPQPGAWWVTSVAADGTVRPGVRYEVPDISPFRMERLASDGAAYLLATRGDVGTFTTEIVALDVDGVRVGWPKTEDGILSYPAIGPQGRVYVTRIQGSGASTRSQTLVYERDGASVAIKSDGLPMAAADEGTGAGVWPAAPTIAADGIVVIVGDAAGRTVAYAIDPSGHTMPGWPYRPEAESQTQGVCPARVAGCGVWRTVAAVGSDDTTYLLVAPADKKKGGSIVAIGTDGQVPAGWPVRIPAVDTGFWSVVVGSDGTVYALAVEPAAGRNSWTLYAIDPDGAVRARTPMITP